MARSLKITNTSTDACTLLVGRYGESYPLGRGESVSLDDRKTATITMQWVDNLPEGVAASAPADSSGAQDEQGGDE